jgi:nucleoside-diphosphate-sugar epimerase
MDTDRSRSVLITGGRGFVGRAVVKLLLRQGCRVVALDVAPSSAAGDDLESVRDVVCDISDADELQRAFEAEPIDGIIHLAAILPTAAQREPLRASQVNVTGSANLLEMARRFGVRRFVFGSSLSIYGTHAANRAVTETHPAAPEDLYGAAKLYVERLGLAYRELYELEFISLRIGRVVGPGAQSTRSAWRSQIFELLGSNEPVEITVPYAGSERLLLVHVDDVARMLMMLLQTPHPGHAIYNAPCESIVVGDLKREVEALNGHISVKLGDAFGAGNPRLLESERFQQEFVFEMTPIAARLRSAASLMSS